MPLGYVMNVFKIVILNENMFACCFIKLFIEKLIWKKVTEEHNHKIYLIIPQTLNLKLKSELKLITKECFL